MKVTLEQLAWYLERDGWKLERCDRGDYIYASPDGALGRFRVRIPEEANDDLNLRRDRVYRVLAERRRRS